MIINKQNVCTLLVIEKHHDHSHQQPQTISSVTISVYLSSHQFYHGKISRALNMHFNNLHFRKK